MPLSVAVIFVQDVEYQVLETSFPGVRNDFQFLCQCLRAEALKNSLETKKVARKSAGRTPNDLLSKCIAKIERLERESDAPEARIEHLIEAKGRARSAVEAGIDEFEAQSWRGIRPGSAAHELPSGGMRSFACAT